MDDDEAREWLLSCCSFESSPSLRAVDVDGDDAAVELRCCSFESSPSLRGPYNQRRARANFANGCCSFESSPSLRVRTLRHLPPQQIPLLLFREQPFIEGFDSAEVRKYAETKVAALSRAALH